MENRASHGTRKQWELLISCLVAIESSCNGGSVATVEVVQGLHDVSGS
jgi:hypothetical protein